MDGERDVICLHTVLQDFQNNIKNPYLCYGKRAVVYLEAALLCPLHLLQHISLRGQTLGKVTTPHDL